MAKETMTSFDKDISMELSQDEELLWRGAPQKASFVLSRSVQLLPIALIWLCFDGFGIFMVFTHVPKSMWIGILAFFAVHLFPVWLWIYQIISAKRKHKLIEYAFTNKRIIIRDQGILKSYYYKDLSRVSVKVGFIDKMFKVGDITLSGRRSITLLDIDNPYVVGNKLQQFLDAHAEERRALAIRRIKDVEFENYYEERGRIHFDHDDGEFYEDEFYDDDEYSDESQDTDQDSFRVNFGESVNVNGRYTSKKKSPTAEKTEEDDYLDNIMDSINKKDEF